MDVSVYQVGKVSADLIGKEKIVFDITDGGGILYVLFSSPTENEIRQFKEDIEIRYVKVGSVFMMLFKFGSLNWVDAPYSPHLSKMSGIAEPADGEGIALQIIFGDADTGMVHGLRLIGLSTEFSRKLAADISADLGHPFDKKMYGLDLAAVFNTYPTSKLVSMAETSCRIRRIDNV